MKASDDNSSPVRANDAQENDVEHRPIDPEEMAAFADGRLRGEARRAMVERLASDREARDLLADVMAVRDAIETEDAADEGEEAEAEDEANRRAEPPPGRLLRGPWTRRAWAGVAALAAALALFVVAPRLLGPGAAPSLDDVADELEIADLDVLDEPIWSVTRSGSRDRVLRRELGDRGSFRWGVRALDFRLAALSGDPERVARAAYSAERVLAGTDLQGQYEALAAEAPDLALEAGSELAALGSESVLAEPFFFRYGLWVRAAWLAAVSGEADFFASAAGRSIEALEAPADADPVLAAELADLQALRAAVAAGETEPGRAAEVFRDVLRRRSR